MVSLKSFLMKEKKTEQKKNHLVLLYGSTCYCLCSCNALQTVGLGLGLALEAADTVKLTHDTPGLLVTGSQPSPHLTQTHNPP